MNLGELVTTAAKERFTDEVTRASEAYLVSLKIAGVVDSLNVPEVTKVDRLPWSGWARVLDLCVEREAQASRLALQVLSLLPPDPSYRFEKTYTGAWEDRFLTYRLEATEAFPCHLTIQVLGEKIKCHPEIEYVKQTTWVCDL